MALGQEKGERILLGRIAAVFLFGGLVFALAGCGGGSDSGAEATVTVTTEATPTSTTGADTRSGDTTKSTGTTATSTSVNVGETATWRGDAFSVSDVGTSGTAPVADPLGEKQEAENGVWLSFKITPANDNSAIWSPDFTDNIQIKGGDGVVYDDEDSSHNNAGEQNEFDERDFLVWIDIPEAAVSGAVLEINDDLHPEADATRVDLGL